MKDGKGNQTEVKKGKQKEWMRKTRKREKERSYRMDIYETEAMMIMDVKCAWDNGINVINRNVNI